MHVRHTNTSCPQHPVAILSDRTVLVPGLWPLLTGECLSDLSGCLLQPVEDVTCAMPWYGVVWWDSVQMWRLGTVTYCTLTFDFTVMFGNSRTTVWSFVVTSK